MATVAAITRESSNDCCSKTTTTTTAKALTTECPAEILQFLEKKFECILSYGEGKKTAGRDDVTLLIQQVQEVKSAQQKVLILSLDNDVVNRFLMSSETQQNEEKVVTAEGESRNRTTAVDRSNDSAEYYDAEQRAWKQALRDGSSKLVVRLWKNGARWWNLHQRNREIVMGSMKDTLSHDSATAVLAASELAGYRIARKALLPTLRIPRILAASPFSSFVQDDNNNNNKDSKQQSRSSSSSCRWAIFEYVGESSTLFRRPDEVLGGVHEHNQRNNEQQCDHDGLSSKKYLDDSWLKGMIFVRDEFGFSEPHPRWGRVPTDQALDYALTILHRFLVPLHRALLRSSSSSDKSIFQGLCGYSSTDPSLRHGYTYHNMVQLYENAHIQMVKYCSDHDYDERLNTVMQKLGRALAYLKSDADLLHPKTLQPVLVHMDCQPQNLLFSSSPQSTSSSRPDVSTVLDWEEAAYADPRFELLMICRKVCANRTQALVIWETYQKEMQDDWTKIGAKVDGSSLTTESSKVDFLGPLEPWLHLETVHSSTTLLMQSMDLLGGGRSPWETKPDLWGKIDREFQRLLQDGWDLT